MERRGRTPLQRPRCTRLTRVNCLRGRDRHGVRCNAVAPGIIESVIHRAARSEQFEGEKKATPLRRFGTTDEVANVVFFLVSEQSAYVTGEVVNVSGGWYMRP